MRLLKSIKSVTATAEEGVLSIECVTTGVLGDEDTRTHCYRPDDPYGISPQIRDYLERHKRTITVLPYPGPDPVARVVPTTISDRQFFQQLAIDGIITEEEALLAVKTGDLPDAIEAFLAQIDEAYRFGARMVLSGATSFERGHPLVESFGEMQGMSSDQIDDLWVRASLLN